MTKIFISLLFIFEFVVVLSQARNTPKVKYDEFHFIENKIFIFMCFLKTPIKKKMNDFIKDIYNMKSVDDLTKHGVKTQRKSLFGSTIYFKSLIL